MVPISKSGNEKPVEAEVEIEKEKVQFKSEEKGVLITEDDTSAKMTQVLHRISNPVYLMGYLFRYPVP